MNRDSDPKFIRLDVSAAHVRDILKTELPGTSPLLSGRKMR